MPGFSCPYPIHFARVGKLHLRTNLRNDPKKDSRQAILRLKKMRMSSDWKQMAVVSLSTVGSRLLGLLRDVATYALLGAGALNSAFLLAFTLPNLFRRLLGEGALSSATIPILTQAHAQGGDPAFFTLLNQVLTRLSLVLLTLVVLGSGLLALVLWPPPILAEAVENLAERWQLGAGLCIVLLSYTLLICLAAILGAALNVRQRFTVAALSQVWLNTTILLCLGAGAILTDGNPLAIIGWLCLGVLLGGLLQLGIPAFALAQAGWSGRFDLRSSPELQRILQLFLPATLGAAILQINGVVSRILGFSVDDAATALLYLASRLIEFPLGIFAVAISTVLFPKLARLHQADDEPAFALAYARGQQLVFAFCLPATIGLVLLREPIISVLFQWGAFTAADTSAAATPLWIYALALPFYGYTGLATRVFHARQNTRLPVRAAGFNFVLNLTLCLLLMGPLGIAGIALAGLIGSIGHAATLHRSLRKQLPAPQNTDGLRPLLSIVLAATSMGIAVEASRLILETLNLGTRTSNLILVCATIPAASLLYFALLHQLAFPPIRAFLKTSSKNLP